MSKKGLTEDGCKYFAGLEITKALGPVDKSSLNDYEKVKQVLTSLGVGFEELSTEKVLYIQINEDCEKAEAYSNFKVDFNFDFNGNFIDLELYE